MSGEGARLYGGRYNPKGIPALYASASIALAALEVLVHLDKSEVPYDYAAMAIEFGSDCVERLSADRTDLALILAPVPVAAGAIEAAFYRKPILRVRSAVISREYNYVLLPSAPGFRAQVRWIESF